MDIFQSVSNTISGIFKRNKQADPVDKQDILNLIDNNILVLRLVVDTYEKAGNLFRYFQTDLLSANGANKDNTELRTLYEEYFSGLNSVARQNENSAMLRSVYIAARLTLNDNQVIRDNFDLLFKEGTNVGDISIDQMKLSHATVFGFINLSGLLADWFCFFVGQVAGNSAEIQRVPAYRIEVVRNSGKTVADFVNDVLVRGTSRNIISVVQSLKSTGDVAIYTSSSSLNTYANINDYAGIAKFIGIFDNFQPILWVRGLFGRYTRWKYKRNLAMREWIQSKIVILQLDADNTDPALPVYQKQLRVVQRYSDELAKLDRKISDYELT